LASITGNSTIGRSITTHPVVRLAYLQGGGNESVAPSKADLDMAGEAIIDSDVWPDLARLGVWGIGHSLDMAANRLFVQGSFWLPFMCNGGFSVKDHIAKLDAAIKPKLKDLRIRAEDVRWICEELPAEYGAI
jgi:hypothetical protein